MTVHTGPICVITCTPSRGTVLTWYHSAPDYQTGHPLISAGRDGVQHHTFEHEIPLQLQADAQDAYDLMLSDHPAEARQRYGTHVPRLSLLTRGLAPINWTGV
jgi:hypothetical protein